ncbi:hypothetical protein DICVIV_09120 [Dictyocaulus viviparus]|uniref:Uncharacterized protein n=1 Tax=Dictyocaulus viviparus TaxID=29172 RepID=A0A0D8XM68_DICVI|nr:hypothetical protein DICVIV_09120 [Dictyocaulus viviparus]
MSGFSPKPYANVKCEPQPSTSTANEATLPMNSPCHPSPALARSVPSSQEATSPSETAGKDFVFFTTELANQAALDFEKERFESLLEWHRKYRKRKAMEVSSDDSIEKPTSSVSVEPTCDVSEIRAEKRKAENDSDENDPKKPTYKEIGVPVSFPQKIEETPLRKMEMMTNSSAFSTSSSINDVVETPTNGLCKKKMEMMTNSSAFSTSSSINDVVETPTNGLCKKDERSAKLEKLGEMERQVEAERLRVEWEKEVQAHEMKKLMQNQGLSPYSSSMFSQVPNSQGAMYPAVHFPGRYPNGSAPYPMGSISSGVYPSAYPNSTHSYPSGYPLSAPGKSQIASPAFIGDPMTFKGTAMPPPGMSPHHPMYAHMMATRASAGMPSPVPVSGYPDDPGRPPFAIPGQSPAVSPFHQGPFPVHPYNQVPYGPSGMAKGMVHPPQYPFPGAMVPVGQGLPPNPGMVRGVSSDPRWQGGVPLNYPPSFPSIPPVTASSNPCQHLTPPKQGLAV